MRPLASLIIAVSILCGGCSTPVYRQVVEEKASFNQRDYAVSQDILYQAVVRAMLSRSFIVENEQPAKGFILGKRSFQQGRKTTALLLQAKLLSDAPAKTRLYLSAVETTERSYVSDRTRFFLFIIPLPGGGGKEASQVKEGETVVQDKVFYRKFFDFIDGQVQEVKACKPSQQEITAVTSPVVQPSSPLAVPQPAPVVIVEPSQTAVVAPPVAEQKEPQQAQSVASPEPAAAPVPATIVPPASSDEKAP